MSVRSGGAAAATVEAANVAANDVSVSFLWIVL